MADLNEGRAEQPRSRARFLAFGITAVVVFTALGGRLVQLQVIDGATYAARAEEVTTMEVALPAARGLVFDRAGRPLAVNVPSWTVKARKADLPGPRTGIVLGEVARVTGLDSRDLRRRLDAFQGSPFDLVPLARGIDREAALVLGERADELPGIVVEAEPIREYLDENGTIDGSLLAHIVGYTGAVSADELDALEPQGYLPDDVIGRAGIERTFEKELRGTYGTELVERLAGGRPGNVLETLRQPVAGRNLQLTIDADVQRIATNALTWGMKAVGLKQGVTIVMNPQTGEILAMVSLPSFDNNKFADGISAAEYQAYLDRARPAAPQPRHLGHLPAGLDLQAGHRPRGARGRGHHPVATAGRPTAATRSRMRPRASASSTGTMRLRAARHHRRLRDQLRHVLLPDGRQARRRQARRTGPIGWASGSGPRSGCRTRPRVSSPARSGHSRRAGRACSPASWPRPASARTSSR